MSIKTEARAEAENRWPHDFEPEPYGRFARVGFVQGAEWRESRKAEATAPELALTNAEWREFQAIPEQGYSHRYWVDWKIQQRVLSQIEKDAAIAANEADKSDEYGDGPHFAYRWGRRIAAAIRAQLTKGSE